MSKIQRMSDAEKKIMEFIWETGRPVTTREILANLPEDKTWKQNTVITFLARLMGKGILKAAKIGKAYHYEPAITENEYKNFETKQFVAEVHKGSVYGLISSLCDNGDLTGEDIERLIKQLNE